MFDRRLILHVNWVFMGTTVVLLGLGVLNLYSASALRTEGGVLLDPYYQKQLMWGGAGGCAMLACMLFDYRHLKSLAWPMFVISMLLLLAVPVFGKTIYGARRWISLGLFNLQPSEIAKICVLVLGAKCLARIPEKLDWRVLIKVMFIGVLPAAFIVKQPDLGSGLTVVLLLGGMVLYKGVETKILKASLLLGPLLLPFGWFFLHDYQKQRILTFLNPGRDPLGAGYHIIQSQIAIGSGQFWGKGFLEGTQSQLSFLPEKHTDFAFAVFGEEWGFLGAMVLLVLFCVFLYQIVMTSQEAKDNFGSLLCAGVFFYFFLQILINMGMVLGLMPVVGIPLPFISYGGSASVVNFCLIGLVLNVSMRRYVFKK
ncbi:rod shape-determining protein RodA [Desulfoplanes sp.]